MRILLVEDEKDLREALRDTLAACGYTVECGATGPDGLDALWSGGCDLALLDRMLGLEVGLQGEIELNRTQRSDFLSAMLSYFSYHLEGINSVQSIRILREVF